MLRTNGKSVEVILEDKDEVFDKCLIKFTDNDIDKKDIIMPFLKQIIIVLTWGRYVGDGTERS